MGGGQWSGQWRPERTLLSLSLSLLSTMAQKPKPGFSNGIIPSVSSGSLFTDFLCVFPLHETADMRASHQHVVPAPFFFLSRPGCFRRPVRGPNLLSVYCQPSLLSWEGLFKRDRRRGGGKDTRLPSESGTWCCVKAEGRRVGLSHATSLRTSEWPSARRIWREREERESVREGERRRRHRRSAASVASNQPSPLSNVCSIHARKREGPDADGRTEGREESKAIVG